MNLLFQDQVKEKLRLVQDFLHDDAQDQLTNLEEKMKNSEISKVRDSMSLFLFLPSYMNTYHNIEKYICFNDSVAKMKTCVVFFC